MGTNKLQIKEGIPLPESAGDTLMMGSEIFFSKRLLSVSFFSPSWWSRELLLVSCTPEESVEHDFTELESTGVVLEILSHELYSSMLSSDDFTTQKQLREIDSHIDLIFITMKLVNHGWTVTRIKYIQTSFVETIFLEWLLFYGHNIKLVLHHMTLNLCIIIITVSSLECFESLIFKKVLCWDNGLRQRKQLQKI